MNFLPLPRAHGLLAVALVTGLAFCWQIRPRVLNGTIKASIEQQADGVITIDTPRNTRFTDVLLLDTIKFPERDSLVHSSAGRLGFTQNFFIDFTGTVEILKPMSIKVLISSDDGFRLFFDNVKVCEWIENRGFADSECYLKVVPGKFPWKLSYFQGGGPLGLEARYQVEGEERFRLFGRSSDFVIFLPEKLPED